MQNLKIRTETPADIDIIHAINAVAFGRNSEADLVTLLRDDDALLLSHIAELDGEVVGHAGYSLVTVSEGERVHHFPGLGPIAVKPELQRQGIGSALLRAGMKSMREMGYGLLFLVGHVSYYPRFGFQPAQPLGFSSDYVKPDGPHEHFMVAVLDAKLSAEVSGHVRYHPAFDEA